VRARVRARALPRAGSELQQEEAADDEGQGGRRHKNWAADEDKTAGRLATTRVGGRQQQK